MFKTAQKNLFVVDFIFLKMHKKSLFVLSEAKFKKRKFPNLLKNELNEKTT